MHRFMTARGPAGSLLHTQGVIRSANDEPSVARGLEMTLEARIGIAVDEQLVIDRPVRRMAGRTPFTDGFMLERKWASLSGVTTQAAVILRQNRRGAAARMN